MGDVLRQVDAPATGRSVALLNGTAGETENATMPPEVEGLSHQFIYSVYAQGISGVFVWAALILTCVQVRVRTVLPWLDVLMNIHVQMDHMYPNEVGLSRSGKYTNIGFGNVEASLF